MRRPRCSVLCLLLLVALCTAGAWVWYNPFHRSSLLWHLGHRERALQVLREARLQDPASQTAALAPLLGELARDPAAPVEQRVAAAIERARLFPPPARPAPLLLELLETPELPEALWEAAIQVLPDAWQGEPEVVTWLLARVEAPGADASTRFRLLEVLSRLGPAAGDAVPVFQRHADEWVRSASWSLGDQLSEVDFRQGHSVPILVARLDGSVVEAGQSVQALGRLGAGARSARAALWQIVESHDPPRDPGLVACAREALIRIGPPEPEHLATLVGRLGDASTREPALAALASLGPLAHDAEPDLWRVLEECDAQDAVPVLTTLHAVGANPEWLLPPLEEILRSPHGLARLQAVDLLVDLRLEPPERTVALLREQWTIPTNLDWKQPGGPPVSSLGMIQRRVVSLLGELGPAAAAAAPDLWPRLEGGPDQVTLLALARMTPEDPRLLSLCLPVPEPGANEAQILAWERQQLPASWRFAALTAMGPAAAPATSRLEDMLLEYDPAVRLGAAGALLAIHGPDRRLQQMVLEPLAGWRPDLHQEALAVLERLGPQAAFAVPALRQLVQSDRVRRHSWDLARQLLHDLDAPR